MKNNLKRLLQVQEALTNTQMSLRPVHPFTSGRAWNSDDVMNEFRNVYRLIDFILTTVPIKDDKE